LEMLRGVAFDSRIRDIIGSRELRSKKHKKSNQTIYVLGSCFVKGWSRKASVVQQKES